MLTMRNAHALSAIIKLLNIEFNSEIIFIFNYTFMEQLIQCVISNYREYNSLQIGTQKKETYIYMFFLLCS